MPSRKLLLGSFGNSAHYELKYSTRVLRGANMGDTGTKMPAASTMLPAMSDKLQNALIK
jgi:hypothetical protein